MAERIKLAAVRYNGKVYTGKAHDLIKQEIASAAGRPVWGEQGFITDKDRFVNREEAAEIAFAAGQTVKREEILFSEDIKM